MLSLISPIPLILGFIVTVSIVYCKYYHSPSLFLLIVLLLSALYQISSNRRTNKVMNFEETLINVSKFIIISAIFGFVVVRIIRLFLGGFD